MKIGRFRFGITELVAGIIGALCYYLLSVLQYDMFLKGSELFTKYVYMPGVLVVLAAAVFGPSVGLIIGMSGQLMANVYVYGDARTLDLFVGIAIGIVMGFLNRHLRVAEGKLEAQKLIDFNIIHVFVIIVTLVFTRPLISFLVEKNDFAENLRVGICVALGNSITVLLLGTPVLWFVNRVMQEVVVMTTLHKYNRG